MDETQTIIDMTDGCAALIEETKATYTNQINMLRRTITALTEELTYQRENYLEMLTERDSAIHALRCIAASQSEEIDMFIKKCCIDKSDLQDLLSVMGQSLNVGYSQFCCSGA